MVVHMPERVPMRRYFVIPLIVFLTVALATVASIGPSRSQQEPKGHIKIQEPGNLGPKQAEEIYLQAIERLARGYGFAADKTAAGYRNWTRYNSSPYRSATHGNRYVNNYANATGRTYTKLKPGEMLPEGTVLAKDSFTVTKDNTVFSAPLFVMEKLGKGKSPRTGDWRYLMIMPDGSVFGDSQGASAKRVRFCHTCHLSVKKDDYVFNVPDEFAVKAE